MELTELDLATIADADADLEKKTRAAERGNADWRRIEHIFVRHGYRLDEIRKMTKHEIDARIDLIIGKPTARRLVSTRQRKPLPKPR
ncbi:hypothetical protein ACYZUC_01090 [Pseudomonas sp. GT1P32]